MDESEYHLRDVKVTLQITKLISIDKTYSMLEIKNIAKELFSIYEINNEYGYHIAEKEIPTIDTVNVLGSLDFANTNEIIIKTRLASEDFNLISHEIFDEFNTTKDRFYVKNKLHNDSRNYIKTSSLLTREDTYLTKESSSFAKNNLVAMFNKLDKQKLNKEDNNYSDELMNKSELLIDYTKLKNYEYGFSNASNFDLKNSGTKKFSGSVKKDKSTSVKQENESNFELNIDDRRPNNEISRHSPIKKDLYNQNHNNYNFKLKTNANRSENKDLNMSYVSAKLHNQSCYNHFNSITPLRISPKMKFSNIRNNSSLEPSNNFKNVSFNLKNTPVHISCSKINAQQHNYNDIWQLINMLEKEIKNQGKINIHYMSKIMTDMSQEISVVYNNNLELKTKKDELKNKLKIFQENINQLKTEMENKNKKIDYYINSLEYNREINQKNEQFLKNFEYNKTIKDKEIINLNSQISDLKENNERILKNIKEYEDYTNELNRTIILLKKTIKEKESNGCQNCHEITEKLEIWKRCLEDYTKKNEQIINDYQNEKLNLKNELHIQKEKFNIMSQEKENFLNKIKEIKKIIQNNHKYFPIENKEENLIADLSPTIDLELDKLISHVNNFTIVIQEKDKMNEILKNNNFTLNSLLEKKDKIYDLEMNSLNEINNKINNYIKEIEKLQANNQCLNDENYLYKEKVKQIYNEKKNEIDLLANEISSLKQREKLIEVELDKRDKTISYLNDSIKQLSTEFDCVKTNKIIEKELELKEKQNKLEKVEEFKKVTCEELLKKDKLIDDLNNKINNLTIEINNQKSNQLNISKNNEWEILEKIGKSIIDEKKKYSIDEIAKREKKIENLESNIENLKNQLSTNKFDYEKSQIELNKVLEEKMKLIFKLNKIYDYLGNLSNNKERNVILPENLGQLDYNVTQSKTIGLEGKIEKLLNDIDEKQNILTNKEILNSVHIIIENDKCGEKANISNKNRNLQLRGGINKKGDLGSENIYSGLKVMLVIENEIFSNLDRKKLIQDLERENKALKLKIDLINSENLKMIAEVDKLNNNKPDNNQKLLMEKLIQELIEQKINNEKAMRELEIIQKNYEKLKQQYEISSITNDNLIDTNNMEKKMNQSLIIPEKSYCFNNSLTEVSNNLNQLNTKIKRSVTIKEGTRFLFTVFDSKRVLKFDLEYRNFKLFEFADYGEFEQNYFSQGSIYLNILDGLVIITGENHDQFFLYCYKKNCINRISKLKDNHSYGSLVYYEQDNSLICCSGWHNKRVEKYINPEISINFLDTKIINKPSTTTLCKSWTQLPEMNVERSECPFIILNDHYLYAFFGFNCPQMKYLDSIERLNLSKDSASWEFIKYLNEKHISTFRKSHSCVKLNQSEVLFIGGYDGHNETAIENFSFFNSEQSKFKGNDRKFPDIIFNHIYNFQKNSFFVPFIDIKSKLHFASIDERENVHVVEVQSLQYDIFKFED